nr:helix-turn-helix transcriptional regulator [Pseudomonas lalkuanensis]
MDTRHLARLFRKRFGLSPAAFRQQAQVRGYCCSDGFSCK